MDRIFIEIRINLDRVEDLRLDELVYELKQRGQCSSIVRDGIRLIVDLRAGRVDVLGELFPWVKRSFVQDSVQDSVQDKGANIRPIPGLQSLAAPQFDDDEDTIIIRTDSNAGNSAVENFLASTGLLQ